MSMIVVTPTYLPDLDLFADLHESVLRQFPVDVRHVVVTPERHVPAFRHFVGPRCSLLSVRAVLGGALLPVPLANVWVNRRHPLPPLRGWVIQQLVKLAVAARAQESVAVMVDADVVFIRPVTDATFMGDGGVAFYRRDGQIDASMPRHMRWHAVARQLLGLADTTAHRLPDYISALNSWDPTTVRAVLRRVEEVRGRPWLQTIGRHLHFSEFILYGVYQDELASPAAKAETADARCAFYWDPTPLTHETAASFLASVKPTDLAVMVSAKSRTPLSIRRAMLSDIRSS